MGLFTLGFLQLFAYSSYPFTSSQLPYPALIIGFISSLFILRLIPIPAIPTFLVENRKTVDLGRIDGEDPGRTRRRGRCNWDALYER